MYNGREKCKHIDGVTDTYTLWLDNLRCLIQMKKLTDGYTEKMWVDVGIAGALRPFSVV